MDEILSSIKRIIADEGAAAVEQRGRRSGKRQAIAPAPTDEDVAADDGDVLELTGALGPGQGAPNGLVSTDAIETGRHAFDTLSTVAATAPPSADNPLEALVRDMLRPMLKDWLDARLPELVETMVAREISRITGR